MAEKKAIYNPQADKKWAEKNREHRSYLSSRSSAKSFIKNKATIKDIAILEKLIAERKKELDIKKKQMWKDVENGKYD